MSNLWFRMYSEVLNDPKVQKLPGELFKIWVNLLCVSCNNNGTLPKQEDVSFALRMPLHETKTAFQELENYGLIVTDNETFHIHNWNKRQYKSDTSTDRVKRHRKQKRNVTVTPPEQIQNRTDTEQKEVVVAAAPFAPPPKKISGTRLNRDWDLPDDWGAWAEKQGMDPSAIIKECDKFKDYWISKSGSNATKTDWEATWRNWIRKHLEEYAA